MPDEDGPILPLFLERYKADRDHELELDRITSKYEIAAIQAAAILNGASATVFLSFLATALSSAPHISDAKICIVLSFLFWMAGLGIALWAGFVAYEAQKGFVAVVRARRNLAGVRVLGPDYGRLVGNLVAESEEQLRAELHRREKKAMSLWDRAWNIGLFSIVLFGAGTISAAVVLWIGLF